MDISKIVQAWRDPAYRATLTEAEKRVLDQHPSGLSPLGKAMEDHIHGGTIIDTTVFYPTNDNRCPQETDYPECSTNYPSCDTEIDGCGSTWSFECTSEVNCTDNQCYTDNPSVCEYVCC
jgi:mersacidin/lichenicidin family type 2 lantibiotic